MLCESLEQSRYNVGVFAMLRFKGKRSSAGMRS